MKRDVRSRNLRRALVLGSLAALLFLILTPLLGLGRGFSWVSIGLYVLLSGGLAWSIGLLDAQPDARLDERQQRVRDHAHRAVYPFVSWYVVGLLLLVGGNPNVLEGPLWGLILSGGLAVLVLPTIYIAWLEPDPPSRRFPVRQMRKPIQPQDVLPSPRLRAFLGKRRNRRVLVVTGNLTFLGMLSLLLFTSELSFP